MTRDTEDAQRNQMQSVRDAADQLRSQIQRVAGNGDGSSWLDQLAEHGQLPLDPPWTGQELQATADLLTVLAQKLRATRAQAGHFGQRQQAELEQVGDAPEPAWLPVNRKERYYTGTVLPMMIGSDNFAHLPRFLRLCGLPMAHVDMVGPQERPDLQFFTEYSFTESVVTESDRHRFGDRPREADTPDLVLVGPDWLLAVEAKVYHRPTRQALETQMRRQRVLVDYWAEKLNLAEERVAHVLLLPQGLSKDRPDLSAPVATWEQVLGAYVQVGPPYWVDVLRLALHQYPFLASSEPSFRTNAEDLMTGQAIYAASNTPLQDAWMGRAGGLSGERLRDDIESGLWRSRTYEVRHEPLPSNPNWFPINKFIAKVRIKEVFTYDDGDLLFSGPPHVQPPAHTTSSVTMYAHDGRYLTASMAGDSDGVELLGQDLRGSGGEYEYALRIRGTHLPRLRQALGGVDGDDVLGLLRQHGEAVYRQGETRWLEEHSIPYEFWSRRH